MCPFSPKGVKSPSRTEHQHWNQTAQPCYQNGPKVKGNTTNDYRRDPSTPLTSSGTGEHSLRTSTKKSQALFNLTHL